MSAISSGRIFIEDSELEWKEVDKGVSRKIMSWDDRVMMVKVKFEKGAIGAMHKHYHTQVTHIEEGEFEVTVANEMRLLKAGDGFFIPPDIMHGVVCKEAGILVDVFSPHREDFL